MAKRPGPPLEVARSVRDTCLCFHFQRAARAVARRFDEAFRPLDLTSGQFTLMMSLSRGEPRNLGTVAAALAMDRTTLTANLKPLERRGLVRVRVDEADRRSRLLSLTPSGRRLIAAAMPLWRQTQAAIERLVVGPDRLRSDLRALS
jgi:DNA-binding MarR family transcriptional regulator